MQAPDRSPYGLPPPESQSGEGEAPSFAQPDADETSAPRQMRGAEAQASRQPGGDDAWRRRLRWRSRRGLLENDLVFERFFKQFGDSLDDQQVAGLDELLDLSDNELLDLILGRTEPGQEASPAARRVLETLRSV